MDELGAKLKGLFSFKKEGKESSITSGSKDPKFKGSGHRLGSAQVGLRAEGICVEVDILLGIDQRQSG